LSRFCGWPVKLREIGEFGFVSQIKWFFWAFSSPAGGRLFFGAGVPRGRFEKQAAISPDLLIEGVRFILPFLFFFYPHGRKSLITNLDDFIDMIARRRFFLGALQPSLGEFVNEFGSGFFGRGAVYGNFRIGGDGSVLIFTGLLELRKEK
jgi:hypothetical protein